ncbi:MAG: hypothetical protein OXC55_09490 [Chloroflexi bacterium]|nr:hypothetical protein [Chloroflexota bacterium]
MTTDLQDNGTTTEVASKRHRLQIDFSPEAHERLIRIRERSEAATNAEVVRNALRLYDWFLDQRARNSRLQLVEGDAVKEIEVLF